MKTISIFLGLMCVAATLADELPSELANLTKQRDAAVERIDSKYVDEVRALKARYTKSGRLAEALACDGILKEKDKSRVMPTEFLVGTKWKGENSGKVFLFDEKYVLYDGVKAKWVKTGNNVTIQFPAGDIKVIVSDDGLAMIDADKGNAVLTKVD